MQGNYRVASELVASRVMSGSREKRDHLEDLKWKGNEAALSEHIDGIHVAQDAVQ
jgi:hypothetical protein